MAFETRQNVEGYGVSLRQAASLLRQCDADLAAAGTDGYLLREEDAKELLAKHRAVQRELTQLGKTIRHLKETS